MKIRKNLQFGFTEPQIEQNVISIKNFNCNYEILNFKNKIVVFENIYP